MALVFIGLVAMVAGSASAQGILVSIDENGNGNLGGVPIPGVVGPDPGPGGLPNALLYFPPPGVGFVPGDVLIFEPGPTPDVLSDVVRFNMNGPVVFYSEREDNDPKPELADVGFPLAHYPNIVQLIEQGSEGNDGLLYTPTSTQPGFVPGVPPVTYQIVSDVPEPSTLVLLAGTALGLLVCGWRRRNP
jgi:hypothetical protein